MTNLNICILTDKSEYSSKIIFTAKISKSTLVDQEETILANSNLSYLKYKRILLFSKTNTYSQKIKKEINYF